MARTEDEDEDDLEESESLEGIEFERNALKKKKYRGTRTRAVRFIFIFSCITVIAASFLSAFFVGFIDLKIAADDATSEIMVFHLNAIDGEIIVRDMIREIPEFEFLRDTIVDELISDSFCLNPNLDDISGQPINVQREKLIQDLSALGDFQQGSLQELKRSLFDVVSSTAIPFPNPWQNRLL